MGCRLIHAHLGTACCTEASQLKAQGCFQPIAGRLCDVFGRKRGFYLGVGAFVVLNIVATFMPVCLGLYVAGEIPAAELTHRTWRVSMSFVL
jgi:MFS family permease